MSKEQKAKLEEKKTDQAIKRNEQRKLDQEFEKRLKSIDLEDEDDIPNIAKDAKK